MHGSTLTLVGRNPATLPKMTELAKLLNNKTGAGMIIERATGRRAAFDLAYGWEGGEKGYDFAHAVGRTRGRHDRRRRSQ